MFSHENLRDQALELLMHRHQHLLFKELFPVDQSIRPLVEI
jgi:hypothetical protein